MDEDKASILESHKTNGIPGEVQRLLKLEKTF